MLNQDNLYRMSNASVLSIYRIIKRRLETEQLNPNVEAIFIINLDMLQLEIDKRGLKL